MLFTLLLSALGGAFYPKARPFVADTLAKILPEGHEIEESMLEVASFALVLLAVAIVLVLAGTKGSAALVLVGGILGAFHKPIKQIVLARMG